ncbi:MAG: tyrosine-type recombinase/integrase [Pleurocapsa sp. MO_192.B19]|nr:tyrosine-type recombinase/integrase [Pleurocapsa sp. MO_192.B19]
MSDLSPVSSTSNIPIAIAPRSLAVAWNNYLTEDVSRGAASADTIRTYTTQIKIFLKWCHQSAIAPLSVSRSDVKAYRRALHEQGCKTSTIALKLSAVRRLYEGAIEAGLIATNPALGIKPPYSRRDPAEGITFLEKVEVKQLLEYVEVSPTKGRIASDNLVKCVRDLFMVEMMVSEGPRTVELHRANLEDIIGQGRKVGIRVLGKRQIRIVPLTDNLINLLSNYLAARKQVGEELTQKSPLLVSVGNRSRGGRLSRSGIRTLVNNYLSECGLKKKDNKTISTHSLRHTAGTLALRGGAELRQVQDLLGHADLRTTAIYVHVGDRWDNNPAKFWLD